MFRFDKLTVKAQEAVAAASSEARRRSHQQIDVEHLLYALVTAEEGVIQPLVAKLGGKADDLKNTVDDLLSDRPRVEGANVQEYASRRLSAAFDKAADEAEALKDEYVSTEHLLLAIAGDPDPKLQTLLRRNGVSRDAILAALKDIRGAQRVTDQNPEEKYQALEKYGKDLTQLARAGKLDPVIGRDAEIRRAIQVLSRRTKNNPVLIGDPGTGKTAIAEGLARRIANGDVPSTLKNKRVFALDIVGSPGTELEFAL